MYYTQFQVEPENVDAFSEALAEHELTHTLEGMDDDGLLIVNVEHEDNEDEAIEDLEEIADVVEPTEENEQ